MASEGTKREMFRKGAGNGVSRGGGGGGGVHNRFCTGMLRSEVQTLIVHYREYPHTPPPLPRRLALYYFSIS